MFGSLSMRSVQIITTLVLLLFSGCDYCPPEDDTVRLGFGGVLLGEGMANVVVELDPGEPGLLICDRDAPGKKGRER